MKIVVLFILSFVSIMVNAQQTLWSEYDAPEGFERIKTDNWGHYLRDFPIYGRDHICKNCYGENIHYSPQGAVLQIDLIGSDLQQCADACMRLRAEYLLKTGSRITFHNTKGNPFTYNGNDTKSFRSYLFNVFSYCNSYSLKTFDTKPTKLEKLKIGDMFCVGGFPGHVVIIMDIAVDNNGNYALMCAQSWMPAQEIEIVLNNEDSPWFIINKDTENIVVGISFTLDDLVTWK